MKNFDKEFGKLDEDLKKIDHGVSKSITKTTVVENE